MYCVFVSLKESPFPLRPIAVIAGVIVLTVVAVYLLGSWAAGSARYASLAAKPAEAKIRIPIRTVRREQIADTWQAPRGVNRKHNGQDIFAPKGTPVYSASAGYIIDIGENELGGKTVWVIGAGGRVYYYAHLDAYSEKIAEGDEVSPDTVLGYVGNSGNAATTPPHLHFGVYTPSGPINPLSLF